MGKKGRERGSRRREFGDDTFEVRDTRESPRQPLRRTPREDTAPTGPAVDATVKWFNAEKGFGFVELGDGSGDAFLHIGVLQNAGHEIVAPEVKLRVQVGQGQKGRQVTSVLEVDASGAGPPQLSRPSLPSQFVSLLQLKPKDVTPPNWMAASVLSGKASSAALVQSTRSRKGMLVLEGARLRRAPRATLAPSEMAGL